jgi:hypothetical protein
MNEPFAYFGWNAGNLTRLGYYVELWNVVARAMRQENPNIMLSQDAITHKKVLDYWVIHGDNVDFLDFHKYDADMVGQYTDAEMFQRAEWLRFETTNTVYGVNDARQKWFNVRGKWLPVINSESNFCSAYGVESGTDPRIQQMAGAVWLALVLRKGILMGLNYNVYFELTGSKSWHEKYRPAGWGFGMINEDDNQPWYPYYVHRMIGSSLGLGDEIVETKSTSDDVRTLVWTHDGKQVILLICKIAEPRIINFQGITGQFNIMWIDSTIPYTSPSLQEATINVGDQIKLNGYTVMLLKAA